MQPADAAALRRATVAVHVGRPRAPGEPLSVPPVLASVLQAPAEAEYGREGSPTWAAFEDAVGTLDGGTALVFASGVAAIAAAVDALVAPGGRVVAPRDAYVGTRALLADLQAQGRVQLTLVESTDTDPTLAAADGSELLWLETATNPLLGIADLPALLAGARARGVRTAVDATFATPLLQRPLELGADAVVHSATKFLSGHSDVLLGVAVAADADLAQRLWLHRLHHGAIAGPMEVFLATRGLRTLDVRLQRAQANAQRLAEHLHGHPAVVAVRYPGLPDDPGHQRAARQMDGFGAMLSFEVAGGAAAADTVCSAVRVAVHATSLGGVETSLERRHRQPGEEATPPALIRVSVGIEDAEDLIADLDQALAAAAAS